MKKISTLDSTFTNAAGSKGQFVLNDKTEKITIVEEEQDVATGNKG